LIRIRRPVKPAPRQAPCRALPARLNEIYRDNPAVIDEDIQLAQYNLAGEVELHKFKNFTTDPPDKHGLFD
jgi:hypothetical protein